MSLEDLTEEQAKFYKELREQSVDCYLHFAGFCYKKHDEPVRCYNEKNWFFYLLGKPNYQDKK